MSNLLAIFASAFSVWAVFRYIILIEIRIDENSFKILYDLCRDQKKIILEEEFTHDKKYPIVYSAICFLRKCPWFYFSHEERLMTAGFNSKEYVSKAIFFRYNYNKFKSFLKKSHKLNVKIPVDIIVPYGSDKIGHIKNSYNPIITNDLCYSIEKDIENNIKTSALLYGNPGTGKTTFIKHLATKFNLPIKIITFSPDWCNYDLLLMFSQIPDNCIVLFEDFDNYFEGRKCIVGTDNKNIKFTFDVILNALDGIYNTYENVIFIMTVNDIEKVDNAIKDRPSRFKYVIEFKNPDEKFIKEMFNNKEYKKLLGMNLDQILTIKGYLDQGSDFENAISKIHKN
jgi:hypothetical protein